MAGLVLPVGHLLGPLFSKTDSDIAESVDVRLGEMLVALPPVSYVLWAATHGDPETVSEQPPSRKTVLQIAHEAEIPEPEKRFSRLVADGLIAQIANTESARRAFAGKYRVIPIAMGLGNAGQNPEQFAIGMVEQARVIVPATVFSVWMFSHRAPTLWSACENVASMFNTEDDAHVRPMTLLAQFMDYLPLLLATSCVCVDRGRHV